MSTRSAGRWFGPQRPAATVVAVVAVAASAAGCSTAPQSPSNTATAGPAATLRAPSTSASDPVVAAAQAWAAAWCPWSWRDPSGTRQARAAALMTPAGAAQLTATPESAWAEQVVATHQVASCGPAAVHFSAGGRNATAADVVITAARTVTDDSGVTASSFTESRRMQLVDGRWLVDVRVEGG